MSRHFVTKCSHCDRVITQCRCPGPNKEIRLDTCEACLRARRDPEAVPHVSAPLPAVPPFEHTHAPSEATPSSADSSSPTDSSSDSFSGGGGDFGGGGASGDW